jgi:pSer/pThr/pTyr-binding forkhead associated (FHA) protein
MSFKSETQSLEKGGSGNRPPSDRLRVLALWNDQHLIYLLPERGSATVGRAEEAEFRISDKAISRQHLKFHVREKLYVEDLGSANGTWVRGRSLKAGETVEVNPGDMIELGRTMLFIQSAPAPARPVQIYTHDYFEARVDDE